MDIEILPSVKNEAECCPIKTFEEALNWKPPSVNHYTEPLHDRVVNTNNPRTLVCHDMKGGYLEDRFLNGCDEDNCYNFIHWSIVDTFVYFSHHLITIPPCGWITAAHRNGTSVLGTFITEWQNGADVCEKIFENKESADQMCDKLVDIASFHGFDGWLLNIENKIQIHQVQHLKEFVSSLTKKMHVANAQSLVIWYDSVIESGELKWQNCLNEHNRDFFLACDGIFLNYGWKTQDLEKTAVEVGARKKDVYVGVDVFGRNEMGKAGFDVCDAVKPARDHGFSIAIFAPGWVYEVLGPEKFWENQYKFWESLRELCFPHIFKSLPFSSTFCPGQGKKMYRRGMVIRDTPWINLCLQQAQPLCHKVKLHEVCLRICMEDAYSGGGCLKLTGILDKNGITFSIFASHFEVQNSCVVSYTFKGETKKDTTLSLMLNMLSPEGQYVLCLTDKVETLGIKCLMFPDEVSIVDDIKTLKVLPMKIKYPLTFNQLIQLKLLNGLIDYGGWIKRSYILEACDFKHHVIKGISAFISGEPSEIGRQCSVYLGELKVASQIPDMFFSYRDFKLTEENNSTYLQCILEWNSKPYVCFWDIFYKFNGNYRYICTTTQTFYRIDNLKLLPNDSEFIPEYPICSLFNFSSHSSNEDCQFGNQIEFFLNSHNSSCAVLETETLKITFDCH